MIGQNITCFCLANIEEKNLKNDEKKKKNYSFCNFNFLHNSYLYLFEFFINAYGFKKSDIIYYNIFENFVKII